MSTSTTTTPTAPPIKKLRAGRTPDYPIAAATNDAISYRSERLQLLSQKYGAPKNHLQPGTHPFYHPASSGTAVGGPPATGSAGGPPMAAADGPPFVVRATSALPPPSQSRQPGSALRGGGRPSPTALSGPPLGGPTTMVAGAPPAPTAAAGGTGPPMVFGRLHGATAAAPTTTAGPQPPPPHQQPPPPQGHPPVPNTGPMEKRRSDIFPTVVKPSPGLVSLSSSHLKPYTAAKQRSPPTPSAASMTAAAVQPSPPTAVATTTTILPSAPKTTTTMAAAAPDDAALARRLEVSFVGTRGGSGSGSSSPNPSLRSKSAPPSRPPGPPPGPPPVYQEEEGSGKSVSFQSPRSSLPVSNLRSAVKQPPPPAGHNHRTVGRASANTTTPFPPSQQPPRSPQPESATHTADTGPTVPNAGVTPFHHLSAPAAGTNAGMTPYHHPATVETPLSSEQPLSTGRRDLLRHLRELADSPLQPPSSETTAVKSPELRWTEQLATTEKEKATALRKVAELQDEIAKMRALGESPYDHTGSSSNNNNNSNKHVGFLSPMANVLLQSPSTTTPSSHHHHHRAASRRVLTPHPKRSLPKATSPSEVDAERKLLMESAERTPFQYDAEGTTFTIRRPHGYAAEVDLWYKAGQLPAKLYANNADVEHPSTIEVAAVVEADDSIFVLFESGHVRHHTSNGLSTEYGNVEERAQPLGTVSYIDRETNEKEYSLDDLYESALYIRGHYCATVRSFAAALQLDRCHHHDNNDNHHHSEPSVPVETADKAVGTDKVLEEPKEAAAAATGTTNQAENAENKSKRSPPPVVAAEESSTDVLVVFLQLLFSTIFRFLWFVLVSLPLRILTATAVTAASVVLLSLLWLYVANDNGAAEMGAVVMRIYSNQHRAGIM